MNQNKCRVSGMYGKDNNKTLHFYCEFCDKEMGYDEDRVCEMRQGIKLTYVNQNKDDIEELKELVRENREINEKYQNKVNWEERIETICKARKGSMDDKQFRATVEYNLAQTQQETREEVVKIIEEYDKPIVSREDLIEKILALT